MRAIKAGPVAKILSGIATNRPAATALKATKAAAAPQPFQKPITRNTPSSIRIPKIIAFDPPELEVFIFMVLSPIENFHTS
jgi:hypothetical protein